MTVSEQIREAIEGYGSTYAVARDSGVAQSTLCRFMQRKRTLHMEAVDTLAEFFGMHLTRPTTKQAKRR